MVEPARIWLELFHHAAFRVGGWAFVQRLGPALSGQAGGARRIELDAAAEAALAAALAGVAPGARVELHTASASVFGLAEAARRPGLVLRRAEAAPRTPTAFAAAWAEQGCKRAKDRGAFTAPIPKSNLAGANA